jgi:hypothetical protein
MKIPLPALAAIWAAGGSALLWVYLHLMLLIAQLGQVFPAPVVM